MADYLSEDLRIRVIEAVEAGSSRRGAAARFGVSVSSAIRWVDVWRRTGRTAPYPRGGDRRSGRIEGAAAFLLAKVEETPDITLAELQALLKERDLLRARLTTGTLVWRATQVRCPLRRPTDQGSMGVNLLGKWALNLNQRLDAQVRPRRPPAGGRRARAERSGGVQVGGIAPVRGVVGGAHEAMDGGRPVQSGSADHPD